MAYIVDVFVESGSVRTIQCGTKREARSVAYQCARRNGNVRPVWCEPSCWPRDLAPTDAGKCIGGYDSSRNGGMTGAVVYRDESEA